MVAALRWSINLNSNNDHSSERRHKALISYSYWGNPNIRLSHKQLSFSSSLAPSSINAPSSVWAAPDPQFPSGPPDVQWHAALRSQLSGVEVQGSGERGVVRVGLGVRGSGPRLGALTPRHAPLAFHPSKSFKTLAQHRTLVKGRPSGYSLDMTTSYDPMFQTQVRA